MAQLLKTRLKKLPFKILNQQHSYQNEENGSSKK